MLGLVAFHLYNIRSMQSFLKNCVVGIGNSLVSQWLGLHSSTAGDMSLIPGPRTKIPQAGWYG